MRMNLYKRSLIALLVLLLLTGSVWITAKAVIPRQKTQRAMDLLSDGEFEEAYGILAELGKPESLITHVQDRPGHDRRYAIDNTKITTALGWKPAYTFEEGIRETIRWYLEHQDWVKNITSGDYRNYYRNMYGIED